MKNKMIMKKPFLNIVIFLMFAVFVSCTDSSNTNPGFEYMPDMYRSPSIGAQSEHSVNGYNSKPVAGTIAQGKLSTFKYNSSNEDYLRAGLESTYPVSFLKDKKNLDTGKELYEMMCSHCHGINGDGKGSVDHPVYSLIPSYSDSIQIRRTGGTMRELKEGHLFHAITYGLNAMGPHSYLVSEDERWKIVYYIQEDLQKNK